jgi:hypothetical protein
VKNYNQSAVEHNAQVINDYGPTIFFRVHHDDDTVTLYGAKSRGHLDLLLRIDTNLDCIRPIKKVVELAQCDLRL